MVTVPPPVELSAARRVTTWLDMLTLDLFHHSTDTPKRKGTKAMRKWGESNPTADDMAQLDFSEDKGSDDKSMDPAFLKALVDEHSRGARTKDGLYEIKDLDMNLGTLDTAAADSAIDVAFNRTAAGKAALAGPSTSTAASTFSSFTGLFSRITGSKPLSKEDLAPILAGMKDHLMKKNVAVDIANKICEGVGESLVGKRVGGFGGALYFTKSIDQHPESHRL